MSLLPAKRKIRCTTLFNATTCLLHRDFATRSPGYLVNRASGPRAKSSVNKKIPPRVLSYGIKYTLTDYQTLCVMLTYRNVRQCDVVMVAVGILRGQAGRLVYADGKAGVSWEGSVIANDGGWE